MKEKIENFKFEPLDASRIMESLHLMGDAGIPYVKIYSLKHLIVPKAVRYLPTLKRVIFKEQTFTDSDLLTIEDFKTFEIVKARDTHLEVSSAESGELIGLKIYAYRNGTAYSLGQWGIFMGTSLIRGYGDLVSVLPIPISEVKNIMSENLYTSLLNLSASSTATLSFLYFLYNFDAKKINHKYMVKVFAVRGTNSDAVDKLTEINKRLRELGDDFLTMLDNLRVGSYFLL
jgi:hypothetical protein